MGQVKELAIEFSDVFDENLGHTTILIHSSEASPTIWSCYGNLNHHYSFL